MALTSSLNEIAFSILNVIRPKTVASEPISIDLIKYHVKNIRALLIKQDSNKGYTPDSYIIQDLGCVAVEPADRSECCSEEIDCDFMRTVLPIPSTIELHHSELLTRVGPIDKIGKNYDQIKYERVPFEGNNRFTKNIIKSFRIHNGGYVYLTTPKNNKEKLLEFINIQGVFEDPELAANFKTCEGMSCYDDNTSFPIKAWMIPAITELVIKKFTLPEAQENIDYKSDGKPDFQSQITK